VTRISSECEAGTTAPTLILPIHLHVLGRKSPREHPDPAAPSPGVWPRSPRPVLRSCPPASSSASLVASEWCGKGFRRLRRPPTACARARPGCALRKKRLSQFFSVVPRRTQICFCTNLQILSEIVLISFTRVSQLSMSMRRTSGNRRSVHAHCQQPRPAQAKTPLARDDSEGGGFPTHRVCGARVGCTCRRTGTVQGVRRSNKRRGGRRPIHTLAGGKHAHKHGDSELLGADRRALLRYQQTDSLPMGL